MFFIPHSAFVELRMIKLSKESNWITVYISSNYEKGEGNYVIILKERKTAITISLACVVFNVIYSIIGLVIVTNGFPIVLLLIKPFFCFPSHYIIYNSKDKGTKRVSFHFSSDKKPN